MQYEFAPLEGITGYIYRNAHHACFPSMDRYYTPFITPKKREKLHDAGVERHCSRAQSEHRGCSADPDESGGRLLQGCRDAQRTGLRRSELKSWLSVRHRDGEEKKAPDFWLIQTHWMRFWRKFLHTAR